MGLEVTTVNYYDNGGGLDVKSSPTKVSDDDASDSLNCDYSTDGAIKTRNGSTILNIASSIPSQISGAPTILGFYDFRKSTGLNVQVIVAGTKIYHDLVTPTAAVTGLSPNAYPDLECIPTSNDEYLVFGNGIDTNLKFDGTTWTNLSLPAPVSVGLADGGAGSLPAATYEYYVSFAVTVSNVIVQEGPLSEVTEFALGASRQMTVTIPVCTDSQCNARVIYRLNSTSGDVVRVTTVLDNSTTTYTDNTVNADLSTIEANFDNAETPKSAIFETDDFGQTWFVDAAHPTDVYASEAYKPWSCPIENLAIFDGPVKCIKRCFGTLLFGTDKSLWVQNGTFAASEPRRISSKYGIINNRCAVGDSILYIMATNRKVYSVTPTDFSQDEMRISDPLSLKIDPIIAQVGASGNDYISMEYYTKSDVSKVMVSVPYSGSTNNRLLVYNESQAIIKNKPVWQAWDNINASVMKQFVFSGVSNLVSGDYNGFLWRLDDDSKHGDGAEENGTATAGASTTLTDSSKTWTVNAYVGMRVRIVAGTGIDQVRTIVSNTATVLTVDSSWGTNPGVTSEYTIGGYDVIHFTNWKYVLTSYDALKQLWFLYSNLNSYGSYSITMILQYNFDSTAANQTTISMSLASSNSIWGSFVWGTGIWGAQSVFQNRFREFARFQAIRIGYKHRKSGQPLQVNGFSIGAQDKKYMMRSTEQ